MPSNSNIVVINLASRFTRFSITLRNGATLTGLAFIPAHATLSATKNKPLLVGIHGATCSAHSWDVSPTCTASTYADRFGVPFVAFNRPNFLDSSGWLIDRSGNPSSGASRFTITEDHSFFEQEGRWYHDLIFPALWETFGLPNGCTALVTTSHSMSVPITIIAGRLYGAQSPMEKSTYPWAGMILTGYGEVETETCKSAAAAMASTPIHPDDFAPGQDPAVHIGPFPKQDKIELMLGPVGCCDPELGELCWRQNTPFFHGEVLDMRGAWAQNKQANKAGVTIPVLYALGTLDWIWNSDRVHVDEFTEGFVNAPRIEGSAIAGAPHAIEWSKIGPVWWYRVYGWACEVVESEPS